MADESLDKKPWYKKPENILVYGGLAALGYVGVQFLDSFLPILNRVLENAIYTAGLFGVLGVIGFLAVNGDFHKLLWYGYTSAMRWLTSWVVELDPIGMMKSAVKDLQKYLGDIKKALGSLRGQAHSLEELIGEKTREHEHSMNLAAQARKRQDEKGMKMTMQLQARKAGRAEQSTLTYQGLLNKLRRHIAVMEKIEEASNFMIMDMQDTIEEESKKREMIHASYKAMSAAKAILAASKQRELYDMALEANVKDYYSKLGEIQQFMEDSQHFINTMDLENGAYEADALAKLDEWEKRSESLLEGGTGKTKYRVNPVGTSGSTEDSSDDEGETQEEKRQSFADLFGNLDK